MFVIYGTKTRKRETRLEGELMCPCCETLTTFTRVSKQRTATLYFLPIAPMGKKKPVALQCDHCAEYFAPDALEKLQELTALVVSDR